MEEAGASSPEVFNTFFCHRRNRLTIVTNGLVIATINRFTQNKGFVSRNFYLNNRYKHITLESLKPKISRRKKCEQI